MENVFSLEVIGVLFAVMLLSLILSKISSKRKKKVKEEPVLPQETSKPLFKDHHEEDLSIYRELFSKSDKKMDIHL